ncbi:putative DNA replication protein DnaD [Clostridium pasteurianum DSM 525 = ATCC 6013]|uniref:Primosome, DnaD subunit n=1 Tax=Clostridium pasteurianum DSM 525 = ATCC 6013 TaxID=1262449 RepID=A0A0H3J7X3_CLOPA|nr:DnaD domain protein [Clostridium pasteurianum]AJA50006.1 putative DNA replication protein DnaD [Clostridium pasteurianum DSM 525 = ATCC 6013]AJA53994.1 putative DNA replication protein DnaD [Clostridium pasteurianum DSM 525 = ATCC 6013]AOZ77137.1 DNA replication protein DnaD [Clostridium pasteurianum DSM 525 = ATCC 6013]AOZ80934.1 DNA replication protein DnaD [Clostridium pasteurianum]ELP59284.1 DNA replication protein DnaD [Clostridium pasteurianum DSM 525 = ATCC 6013]
MSTFMFKNKANSYTPISNIFIDKYMPKARGEYVKVYLLGIKYCMSGEPGINSAMFAGTLSLLETDVMNAWNYWNDEGVVKLIPIDNLGNFNIAFLDLDDQISDNNENIDLLKELNNTSTKDMLQDIENLVARPLSSKEMKMYISWINDFNFPPELILLLIEYCTSKNKTDYRYIERIAISWHDAKINTIENAQIYIKKHEDKWIKIRKILSYLGIKDAEIMKPQQQLLEKWINSYKFSLEVIYRACDITFSRINKADFKYIDAILTNWFKEGIKTIKDIDTKDFKKAKFKKSSSNLNTGPKTNFNNYEQRSYDYDELEKKLLGWDKND